MPQALFPVPIWKKENVISLEIIELAIKLTYDFKKNFKQYGPATLVSDGWNQKKSSFDEEDFKEHGITSFNSLKLLEEENWLPIAKVIHQQSLELLSDTWLIKDFYLDHLWTTIYPKGGYIPVHNHSPYLLSGVCYLQTPENCGKLVFQDPSWVGKANTPFTQSTFPILGTQQKITPKAGDMFLFPGWLPHWTEGNQSDQDRIILSFNMVFPSPPELRIQ